MQNYHDFVEPTDIGYFAGKKSGTPERFLTLRSLDENEFVIRFMKMLQYQRMTREEHHWWCTVLECIVQRFPVYGWRCAQEFFFLLLRDLNQQQFHIGNDIERYSRSYFSAQPPSKPTPLVRLNMLDRGAAETVTLANYFCRYYSVTGNCPQKGICPLEHGCILCFKRTGKKFYHALQFCIFSEK